MFTTNFFDLLFEYTEHICTSDTPYGIASAHQLYANHSNCFFSINPLSGTRKDENVAVLRNILLEFDDMPLAEQLKTIAEIPHSTVVFSGGKSYHCIISLATPCETKAQYNTLVRRIYDRVPGVDKQNSNPSRFSRTPNAIRDNGTKQDLVEVRKRVTKAELEAWLGPDIAPELESIFDTFNPSRSLRQLSPYTLYFLNFGAEPGRWNRQLFLSALDMARCGQSQFQILQQLTEVTGKLDASDKRTINSAIKIVSEEVSG